MFLKNYSEIPSKNLPMLLKKIFQKALRKFLLGFFENFGKGNTLFFSFFLSFWDCFKYPFREFIRNFTEVSIHFLKIIMDGLHQKILHEFLQIFIQGFFMDSSWNSFRNFLKKCFWKPFTIFFLKNSQWYAWRNPWDFLLRIFPWFFFSEKKRVKQWFQKLFYSFHC